MKEFENGLSDVQNGLSGNILGGLGLAPTCLVNHKQNIPASINISGKGNFVSSWSKKQRRCYHRLLSGCKYAVADDLDLRFLTLTSKFEILSKVDELQLNKDFQTLRKRIKKCFGVLIRYCKVRTNEGNGVLHIVFVGCFIPYHWLKVNWEDIHGAWNVDIQLVSGNPKGVARYFVNQYIAGQSSFVRMSRSLDWLPVGAVGVWRNILKTYSVSMGFDYCVSVWDAWLMNTLMPDDKRHIVKKELSRIQRLRSSKRFFDNRMWFLGQNDYC